MNERVTTCGISNPFGPLSPTSGLVTHALLSRPPLTTGASPDRPFDLHVSCTPPAFILSQDQTLRKNARPRGRDFDRGFYPLAGPYRISCHSSVVKVQCPAPEVQARPFSLRPRPPAVNRTALAAGFPVGGPRRPEGHARKRMIAAPGEGVKRGWRERAGRGRTGPSSARVQRVRSGCSRRAG